jgi:CBS domain-containing protein
MSPVRRTGEARACRSKGRRGARLGRGPTFRTDAPNCRLEDRLLEICERLEETGWDTCFVLDERDVVLGRIGRRAIRGKSDVSAGEAMTLGPSTVRPSARLEAVVERMRRQKLASLPVTTSDGRLVGLLTVRDAEEALRRLGE